MLLRREFVMLAGQDGSNIRALCRRYGIQPRIGYKWLARYEAHGEAGLADRPRRPHASPDRTPEAVEAKVLALRRKHPCWGDASFGDGFWSLARRKCRARARSPRFCIAMVSLSRRRVRNAWP